MKTKNGLWQTSSQNQSGMPCTSPEDLIDQTLKLKVKNERTALFEWIKYRCAVYDHCLLMDDDNGHVVRIPQGNLVAVYMKTGSRFELVHNDKGLIIKDELMAPTPQHCQRWIEHLKKCMCEKPSSPVRSRDTVILPTPLAIATKVTLEENRQQIAECEYVEETKPASPVPDKNLDSLKPVSKKSCIEDDIEKPPLRTVQSLKSPAVSPLVNDWKKSGDDAKEQLDILVRVESALKQLELKNKSAMQRETDLRQEVESLHDSLRLAMVEKKELMSQLQDITTERDEWKTLARNRQDEVAEFSDDTSTYICLMLVG